MTMSKRQSLIARQAKRRKAGGKLPASPGKKAKALVKLEEKGAK